MADTNGNLNQIPNPGAGSLSPMEILKAARAAVPAVDYALGAAGIAAAAAIIIGFVGNGRAAFIILGGVFIAMLLLFAFARLVSAQSSAVTNAGIVLLWAVTCFFCIFLAFTATAVAIDWPPEWARMLGFQGSSPKGPTTWSLENCKSDADAAINAFAVDHSNTLRAEKLILCKNPTGYYLRGAEAFYRGAYSDAEREFELALRNLPANAPAESRVQLTDDLASAQIETGKYLDAIKNYRDILNSNPTDGYRWDLGKAYLYQGQIDPHAYTEAIQALRGVSPNFAGQVKTGLVQILLAAALVGKSLSNDITAQEKQDILNAARIELCKGIRKNQDFWRGVLRGSTPYPNASFKEESRLLTIIGDGNITCPAGG